MFHRAFLGVVCATGLALLATPASADTVFGSKLNRQLTPGQRCDFDNPTRICTWVLTDPQGSGAVAKAPHDGTIKKIRLMACGPGTLILQLARAQPASHQARVTRTGPLINYVGKERNCNGEDNFFVESFDVNVPVKQGDYLAVVASKVNFLYSAGNSGDLFFPPLPDGGPFRTADDLPGSGQLMLQAVMTP